ncbi:MAG TPA: hypothetical protein VMX33_13295 [bacterium]|nr:hypothetical protein [bacterium]
MDRRSSVLYGTLLALAFVAVVAGVGLLFVTTRNVNITSVFWMVGWMAVGLILAYYSMTRQFRPRTAFIGLFIISVALIRFVARAFGIPAADYWPLFAIGAGICLLIAGFVRYKGPKPGFIVLSSLFVLLGFFFSIFSFGFSSMRFKTFMSIWWPALIVAAGLFLLVVWLVQHSIQVDEPASGESGDGETK